MTQPAILILTLLLLVAVAPLLVDAVLNRSGRIRTAVSPVAAALHRTLWIADLHADSLLWNRDLLVEHRRGHVDVPRLRRGNVAFQVFTSVTKMPLGVVTALVILQRWPLRSWRSPFARARHQAQKLHRFAERSGGRLVVVRTVDDLEECERHRRSGRAVVAGLLGIEGAHALEGELANLDVLFDAGFRLVGLAHFHDNEVAGSAHGVVRTGLTALGRQVVERMEQLGMIVDLAHASPATIDDVVAIATKPVLASHTGVRAICDSARNLADDQLERIAATGGLIGVSFFRAATCGRTMEAIVRTVRHTVDRVGVDHVALGSDFDGSVRTPFDSAALAALTDALLAASFSDEEIAAIMGANVRRVLLTVLPRRLAREVGDASEATGPS